MEVSLFASSNRPKLYESFFKSIKGTSVEFEVVFSGNCNLSDLELFNDWFNRGLIGKNPDVPACQWRYYVTKNIKPAQCYEIARRACSGQVVLWVADDFEFPNDVIGKAYRYWKSQDNEKLILSIQTRETGYRLPQGAMFDMRDHCFFGYQRSTPLMAPAALMSRKVLEDIGGIDRRYVCGQYENDIVMRVLAIGGKVEVFGGTDCFIDIDHLGKSFKIGESKTEFDFLKRPFATGYQEDRAVLERSWVDSIKRFKYISKTGEVIRNRWIVPDALPARYDEFEPFTFDETKILQESESIRGQWI